MSPLGTTLHTQAPCGRNASAPVPVQLSLFDVVECADPGGSIPDLARQSGAVDAFVASQADESSDPPRTLAEVMVRLEFRGSQAEDPSQRHYLSHQRSALRTLAAVLHRSLVDIPADPRRLRTWIADAPYAAAAVTTQRWSRVRTLTLAALNGCGISTQPGRCRRGRSAQWCELIEKLASKSLRNGTSRFTSFCSRMGLAPADVDVQTFDAFQEALDAGSLSKNPLRIYRNVVRAWNKAAETTPDWPPVVILLDRHRCFYSLAWADFPAMLSEELEAFLLARADTDELSRAARGGAIRATTANNYRKKALQLASLLVISGVPASEIDSLAVLGRYENVERALRALKAHHAGKRGVADGLFAQLASQFAAWTKSVDADDLRALSRRLSKPQKEMTTRNRDRLRQFDDRANVAALLELPDRIFTEQARGAVGIKEARRAAIALAIEILTVSPMRIANLAALEHSRHLVALGLGKRRQVHVVIPGAETKDGKVWEALLPPRTMRLLEEFRTRYRPYLFDGPSPYLFPNTTGGRRSPIAFSRSISDLLKRETGIVMHAHLFRHLAGKLHLQRNPNDIETVRRFLNHRSSTTTIRYYAQQSMAQAFETYDGTLEKLRSSSPPEKPGRRKPRRGSPTGKDAR